MQSFNEFDMELAALIGEKPAAPTATPVATQEPKPEPTPETKPVTIGDTVRFVPSTPTVAEPVAKPNEGRKLRPQDEGKVAIANNVPGFLKSATLYSKGYVRMQWPQNWNSLSLYRPALVALIQWARSPAADLFLAELDQAGIKS